MLKAFEAPGFFVSEFSLEFANSRNSWSPEFVYQCFQDFLLKAEEKM